MTLPLRAALYLRVSLSSPRFLSNGWGPPQSRRGCAERFGALDIRPDRCRGSFVTV